MDRLLPDVARAFMPKTTPYRAFGTSGVTDAKAFAYTTLSPCRLITLYIEGDPEPVDAMRSTLNAGVDKGISLNKQEIAIDHGKQKWKTEVRTFPHVRRAALIAYHPSLLRYNPIEHGEHCYLLQDNPEGLTPWFVNAFGERLKKIVDVTLQPHWYASLLDSEIDAELMKQQMCYGCSAWLVSVNGDRVERSCFEYVATR